MVHRENERLKTHAEVEGMTQLDTLKAAFDRNESLTVAEALSRYGIYAL